MKQNIKNPLYLMKILITLILLLISVMFLKDINIDKNIQPYLMIGFLVIFLALNIYLFVSKILIKDKSIKTIPFNSVKDNNTLESSYNISDMPDISFDDIAGFDEIKSQVFEIIDFIKHPKKYNDLKVKLPKGILLVGPPGVGKTLIAKAIASNAGVPFYYQSGATFVEMYVGLGAKRVVDLFNRAKLNSPSIIFIDEIDAIGQKRDSSNSQEREATLNQLLTQMDGFENSNGTIVIAATNRIDVLDNALLRSGRFDRRVFIHLPTLSDRIKILNRYLKGRDHNINIELISKKISGFSGAEIENLVNESALYALRLNERSLRNEHLLKIKDSIQQNKEIKLMLDDKDRDNVALDKASKALFMYQNNFSFESINLLEKSIHFDDKKIVSNIELTNWIKYYLVGYCAILEKNSEIISYSSGDLKEAKRLIGLYFDEYMMNHLLKQNITKKEYFDSLIDECKSFINDNNAKILVLKKRLLDSEIIKKEEINEIF